MMTLRFCFPTQFQVRSVLKLQGCFSFCTKKQHPLLKTLKKVKSLWEVGSTSALKEVFEAQLQLLLKWKGMESTRKH